MRQEREINPLVEKQIKMENGKLTLEMDGKEFNECWCIKNFEPKDDDNLTVNFINETMVNVMCNNNKVWSVINPF